MPTYDGTNGDDNLAANDLDDILNGFGGNDQLQMGARCTASGGSGDDLFLLFASAEGSIIDGGEGFDTISVEVNLGPFSTTLAGLSGIERILLVNGHLALTGSQWSNGFAANGSISGAGRITVNLGVGDPFVFQSQTVDAASIGFINLTVNGSSGGDIIKCSSVTINTVTGGAGIDQIRGGRFNDTISGGDDSDKIMGLAGADILTGGAGADQFRYLNYNDSGVGVWADVITDFNAAEDRLSFAAFDADPLTPGRQGLTYIAGQNFHARGVAELRLASNGSNLVMQADLDGNGTVDMEIILQNALGQTLTTANFIF